MHLGWKILLPVALAYIGVTGTAILVLDQLGMEYGLTYGLVLTAVNVVATAVFLWLVDRDHVMSGSWITQQKRLAAVSRRRPPGRAGEEPSREEAAWR